MKSAAVLKETKGWLIIAGIGVGVVVVGYFLVKRGIIKLGSDLAAAPGAALSKVGDLAAGTVAGAADAVGKYGLAVNDALGGIPGNAGSAVVNSSASQRVWASLFGESFTGYSFNGGRWTQVQGLNSGNIYNLDANNNVLDASGSVIGQFNQSTGAGATS